MNTVLYIDIDVNRSVLHPQDKLFLFVMKPETHITLSEPFISLLTSVIPINSIENK